MENKQIMDIVQNRCAIKDFDKSRRISDDDFNMLLKVAQCSPSAFGLEPWRIIVLQNADIREKLKLLATGAQRQLGTCSHFVVFTVVTALEAHSDYIKHISMSVKGMDDIAYNEFVSKFKNFQEQRKDLTDSRKRIDWACKQAYIAMTNMMMAAAIKKIDSCPIEGFSSGEVDEFLSNCGIIKKGSECVAVMLALGYKSEKISSKKNRRSLCEIVKYI